MYKHMTYQQMIEYFHQGLFKDTLVGKGKFLMIDGHYEQGHCRLYILDQVIAFATKDNIQKIKEGIYGAIDELIEDNDVKNLLLFVWSLLLRLDGKYEDKNFTKIFNFNQEFLTAKIFPYISSKSQLFVSNEEERRSLLLVCSKLPQLADKLGFDEIEVIKDEQGLYVTEIKTKPKH